MRRYMRENNESLPSEWCSYGEDYFYENYSMMDYRIIKKIKINDKNSNLINDYKRRLKNNDTSLGGEDAETVVKTESAQYANNRDNVSVEETRRTGSVHGMDGNSSERNCAGIDKESSGNFNRGRKF